MSRVLLDNELQGLDAQVIQLGSLVDAALAQALEALEMGDQDRAGTVAPRFIVGVSDTTIDDLHLAIEERTFRVLILQQPLAGHDLRYLTSLVPLAIDLERIGDEAEDIARNVLRMLPFRSADTPQTSTTVQQEQDEDGLTDLADTGKESSPPTDAINQVPTEASIIRRILDLGREVRSLLQWTMKAFAERNAEAARSLWEQDKVIDQHSYAVRRDVMLMLEGARAIAALQQDPHMVQRATHLLWIVYLLGRVADHCTNICERIVFIVEGEIDILTSLED